MPIHRPQDDTLAIALDIVDFFDNHGAGVTTPKLRAAQRLREAIERNPYDIAPAFTDLTDLAALELEEGTRQYLFHQLATLRGLLDRDGYLLAP